MKYMGSKAKYVKELLPIILQNKRVDQWYIEPFAGGCNTISKVGGNRLANDTNKYVMCMFEAACNGWRPPDVITEQEYHDIKTNQTKYQPELVGFVGIGCSYAGKWWGGYARGNTNKGLPRNYCLESKTNLINQVEGLRGTFFSAVSFEQLVIPNDSIIYCDPPYANTTKYGQHFSSDKLFAWCRKLASQGHTVFLSEYNAPSDFIPVWEKTVYNTLVAQTGSKVGVERLYTCNHFLT